MEVQQESIFVSAMRGFFRSLFVILGIFAAIFLISLLFLAISPSYEQPEQTTLEILPDLDWKKQIAPMNAPVILRINVHGIIGDPEQFDSDIVESILIDSRAGLLSNERVKAILLHFNTPGGAAFDSDNIYRLLLQYKKRFSTPIFGYVDGLCASGGMYIASAADKMYCSPPSVVGSVGVISGPFFNVSDAIGKIGVQSLTITEGIGKDEMNPFRPWKPDEDETLKKIMDNLYQQFVDIVTTARTRLDKTKLVKEYGAKVFDGKTAMELGYVDVANSSYEEAMLALMKEANIDAAKPYQIVELQPRKNILAELLRGKSSLLNGKVEHRILVGSDRAYSIRDRFAYLYQ